MIHIRMIKRPVCEMRLDAGTVCGTAEPAGHREWRKFSITAQTKNYVN